VINKSPPAKKTVALADDAPQPGSRIRREPVVDRPSLFGRIHWQSREWEIRLATAGMIFFALAITAVVIDLGELLAH
jgi:hypothetical protein